jgi:hypothetical protein
MRRGAVIVAILLLGQARPVRAEPTFGGSETLRSALRDEMGRAVAELSLPDLPRPYFISGLVTDQSAVGVTATLGAIRGRLQIRMRLLQVDVRVGDYAFDNSGFVTEGSIPVSEAIPFEDDYLVLRRSAWRLLDEAYKAATSTYEAKRAQRRSQAEAQQRPGSLCRVAPQRSVVEPGAALPTDDRAAGLA